ncbi:MAG TPA: copper resistance CopC family protein [Actinomycetes bacterium]|nr:copper resistance CopC family protein [Actinomycetes bacterium]
MRKTALLRRLAVSAATASVAVGALATAATPASAHSELIGSTPSAGETLAKAPSRVELVFNEPVQQEGGTISVSVRDTVVSDDSTFSVNGTDASVQLRAGGDGAQAGRYTVDYRIVSEDGHVISDSYAFQVRGGSIAQASDEPTADTTPLSTDDSDEPEESSASVVWVLGAGAIGLALVAALIAVATRGRRGRSS